MITKIATIIETKTAMPKNVKVHPYPAVLMKGWTKYWKAKLISEKHIARITTISPNTPRKLSIAYAGAIEQALTWCVIMLPTRNAIIIR
jgi:hypothetical protein